MASADRARTQTKTRGASRGASAGASDGVEATSGLSRFMRDIGYGYFALALSARLPFAMMTVGVLTMVVDARDSIALGGITAAVLGVATMLVGPLLGAAADRLGQRPVLLVVGVVNALALSALVLVAYSEMSDAAVLTAAALIGATAPQVSSMSRTRMDAAVTARSRTAPAAPERLRQAVMGLESAIDEAVFVCGPVVVGLLAVAFSPAAAVFAAAAIAVVSIVLFARHRTADLVQASAATGVAAPLPRVFRPRVLTTVVAGFGMGSFFGATLTSLTAFTEALGVGDQTGLLYAVLGVGSAILALCVGALPAAFTLGARWIYFTLLLMGGVSLAALANTTGQVAVAFAVAGCGVGPALATVYTRAAQRAPFGRAATVMTLISSALVLGQALTSAVVGIAAEAGFETLVRWSPVLAGSIVLVAGVVDVLLGRFARRSSPVAA